MHSAVMSPPISTNVVGLILGGGDVAPEDGGPLGRPQRSVLENAQNLGRALLMQPLCPSHRSGNSSSTGAGDAAPERSGSPKPASAGLAVATVPPLGRLRWRRLGSLSGYLAPPSVRHGRPAQAALHRMTPRRSLVCRQRKRPRWLEPLRRPAPTAIDPGRAAAGAIGDSHGPGLTAPVRSTNVVYLWSVGGLATFVGTALPLLTCSFPCREGGT